MKKHIRIVIDILMMVAIVTLFDKRFIGMKYHEVMGIGVCVLLIFHVGINIRAFSNMHKNYAKLPSSFKLGVVLDWLLIASFIYLLVSGILSSHALFPSIGERMGRQFFKLSHIWVGALCLIILGVHIGIHIATRKLPLIPTVLVGTALVGLASYALATTSYVRFITIPYTYATSLLEKGESEEPHVETEGVKQGKGPGLGKGLKKGGGGGKSAPEPLSKAQAFLSCLKFFCLIAIVTVVTYLILRIKSRDRAKK